MTGKWGQMRQTTTAGVRLDHRKAVGSGITRRAIRWLAFTFLLLTTEAAVALAPTAKASGA
jgi:hypothetical protein